jgi:hypothetical protein
MSTNVLRLNEFTEATELGLTDVYKDEYKRLKREYTDWVNEVDAKHWVDTDIVYSGLGVAPEKTLGGRIQSDRILKGPQKSHTLVPYALALVMEREIREWDLYDVFKPVVRDMAKSHVVRMNLVAYGFLINAFNASANAKYLTYRSEAPCSTSHTRLDGGTWSNRLSPNLGLSYVGIQEADILLAKMVNERGIFIPAMGERILCSADKRWIANTLINSELRPSSADNDLNDLKGKYQVHACPYLTQEEYWFLQGPKSGRGFVVAMRIGVEPEMTRDVEISTQNAIFASYSSFDWKTIDPRHFIGSTGTGS